jgi:hypothetical protein
MGTETTRDSTTELIILLEQSCIRVFLQGNFVCWKKPLYFYLFDRNAAGEQSLAAGKFDGSNLVDPASSHMLVSKIKPCMSKYK